MSELSNLVINFIRAHQIDSIQKLHLLLFFQQHQDFEGNIPDISRKLYLADIQLVKRLILDLNKNECLVAASLESYYELVLRTVLLR